VSHPRQSHSGQISIGCSGWAYPGWRPDFYPARQPLKKLLEYYATQLNSVEVNYTFRSLPSETTIQSWLAQTGADFRFSFKAPQRITHILRLRNCTEAMAEFAHVIQPVSDAGRMGLVLFQLPPNMKAETERLSAFLNDAASLKLRVAFEFRHESWFDAAIYRLLEAHGAALCVAESDELETPDILTASFSCYRLRRSEYSAERLAAICDLLKDRAARGDVFAYFKHEDEPTGALRAVAVREGLQEKL
jgi:uncharacterized protein YecE (DUF72 family)